MPLLTFRNLWFQLHWFVGITAGTVLIVIGLSGAVFAFHEEVLDWLNPGTASVPVREAPVLTPQQIAEAVRANGETRTLQRITVHARPGRAAEVAFAPLPGQRRGTTAFVDPYAGTVLPAQRGAAFFDWVERLHRWLLLPRNDGKPITGALAAGLLLLSLSGLYLRWPRRPWDWRAWLTFDPARKGRSFLWSLHSVAGTWALVAYVVFTGTGLYWAFDAIRTPVDRWAGVPARAPAAAPQRTADGPLAVPIDLAPAWATFERLGVGWQLAQLRLPERSGQAVQINWLGRDAPHERARNQFEVALDGTVRRDDRYADLPMGRRALSTIYPLHMGTYFGLPGRIAMALASLMLPLFAVTGWMLYLDRRRKARAVQRERAALAGGPVATQPTLGADPVLVAFASQSGRAERLAVRTAALLRQAGVEAMLASVAQLDAEQLRHHRRALFIVSTFGDGDPPDGARRFARALGAASGAALPHLHYGLLALGDRQYTAFCGFGHALDHQLHRLGAHPVFPMIEMDGENPAAWKDWCAALAGHWGLSVLAAQIDAQEADVPAPAFGDWPLVLRTLCNAGSQGAPLYLLQLTAPADAMAWQPGALAEVLPQHAADAVEVLLCRHGWQGDARVQWQGQRVALRDVLARGAWGALDSVAPDAAPQAVADGVQPLAPRSYSVGSLPGDGHVALWVRQTRTDAGLGMASGWLTAHAPLGASIALRLVENQAFALAPGDAPAVFIGNGSGYAGLRGHLRARMQQGHCRNWLLLGERQRERDGFAEAEASAWLAAGQLERADFVYSRDQPERRYVQDALREAGDTLRRWLADGAILYVCGSLDGMAAGVDAALNAVLGAEAVDDLIAQGRYRRDVY